MLGEDSANRSGDTFPRPDPTKLTTEQLKRETDALKELIFTRMDSQDRIIEVVNRAILARPAETEKMVDHLKGFIEARINGMDRATVLLQEILDRLPRQMDEKLIALKQLHEEKFTSIQTQFRERDVRTEQSSKDSKVAVDAALQAAKEAVGEQNKSSALAIAKSETSTMKQIDALGGQLGIQSKSIDDKISDIKEWLNRIEGQGVGKVSAEGLHQGHNTFYFAVLSAVVAIISVIVTLAVVIKHW